MRRLLLLLLSLTTSVAAAGCACGAKDYFPLHDPDGGALYAEKNPDLSADCAPICAELGMMPITRVTACGYESVSGNIQVWCQGWSSCP
jgi:hypothetical protein